VSEGVDAAASKPGFREIIRASPGRSVVRWCWFHLMRLICTVWFSVFYRFRVEGRERLPMTGPVLIVSNHQSFLDSIILGMATGWRPPYSLARKSLFKGVMGWLFRSLNGIPVDRGHSDIASLRRCIEVLNEGASLAIFPEGTRTEDGSVGKFRAGSMLLVKRAKPVVMPLAITGSFEAWPRDAKLPRLFGRITARWGEPISAEELLKMDEGEALKRIEGIVREMVR
jgi:1-acyl-sn-glycerol-3-phosphate acyltransferase